MQKKTAIIYGIKSGDRYYYIGKKIDKRNSGNLSKSDITYQYKNENIKNVFSNNKSTTIVESIQIIPEEQWYDEKLNEVLKKHRDNHPLLNSQWMLEGKRGYWEGKQRDDNTIKRLSESKFIKIVEYDDQGRLKKIWNSAKEVAITVFKDYMVINGGGNSFLYDIIKTTKINSRFYHNSYWFRYSELLSQFGQIPQKLNIEKIFETERKKRSESARLGLKNKTHISRYTVEKYVDGILVEKYLNTYEAGYKLKLSVPTVQKLCRGIITCNDYALSYGEKKLQPMNPTYPEYKTIGISKPKRNKKPYIKHRTWYTVEQFDANGNIIHTYLNVNDASQKLGIGSQAVRGICTSKSPNPVNKHNLILKYGKKIQVMI